VNSGKQISAQIDKLEEERSELRRREASASPTLEGDRMRLQAIQVELDRLWDLRRQRAALREAGQDPNRAEERSEDTVEGYWQ
jgi:flagellar biosynthesis chaperone FliJ